MSMLFIMFKGKGKGHKRRMPFWALVRLSKPSLCAGRHLSAFVPSRGSAGFLWPYPSRQPVKSLRVPAVLSYVLLQYSRSVRPRPGRSRSTGISCSRCAIIPALSSGRCGIFPCIPGCNAGSLLSTSCAAAAARLPYKKSCSIACSACWFQMSARILRI